MRDHGQAPDGTHALFVPRHFRRSPCRIQTLAKRHFDTKFTKISVEKAPFLVEKLKIQVLPCVISFVNGISADRYAQRHPVVHH